MVYQTFAKVYDDFMDDSLYDDWLIFVEKFVSDRNKSILELACGTGILAVKLQQAGFTVTGLDLSNEMLSIANERANIAKIDLPLIEGNMLDLADIGKYDVVTSFSDSLCYMPDEKAVAKVFREVANILNEEGLFLFDVHSMYQVNELFPGFQFHDETEETVFMWSSFTGEKPNSIEHDLSFFVWNDEKQAYDRLNELHEERTYPMGDYVTMLKQAGFQKISIYEDFGKARATDKSTRWFFVCEH